MYSLRRRADPHEAAPYSPKPAPADAGHPDDLKRAAFAMLRTDWRTFPVATALKYCAGNSRQAEVVFGLGRQSVEFGLHEKRSGVVSLGSQSACPGDKKRWPLYLGGPLLVTIIGCTAPLQRTGAIEEAVGREQSIVVGDPFQHLIYRQGIWDKSSPVHVYLEGDGLPWVTRTRIARDPTPLTPLALRLMSHDPGPSLYIGRPCYHGLAESPGCSHWLWTHGRYGEEVVRSMTAAVQRALGPDGNQEVTLIGYSGGGVLAMLIAARLEQVRGVVTIAANLDITTWADLHGYSPLLGSINPATQPPLPSETRQIHLAGERDRRVPARLSAQAVARQSNARRVVVLNFDHVCCWERAWPAILAGLKQRDFVLDQKALPSYSDTAAANHP